MRRMKRWLAVLLALVIVVGMLPASHLVASADTVYSGQCGENAFWNLDVATGIFTVSGTGDMYDYWDGWVSEDENYKHSPWKAQKARITSVIIEPGITSIGGCSFSDCNNLQEVSISETVRSIGLYSFGDCNSLTSIEIPGNVKVIGQYTFENCEKLTQITLKEGLEEIKDDAFNQTAISSIYIPSSVTNLHDCDENYISDEGRYWNVFQYCPNLTDIQVGEGNMTYSIVNGMLYNKSANALLWGAKTSETITVPEGTIWIADACFDECTNMKEITIPTTVEVIGQSAFANCSSLKSITVPEGTKKIGWYAFMGCSNLQQLSLPSTITDIGFDRLTFYDCYKLENVLISKDNETYTFQDGLLYNKNMTTLYWCSPGRTGSVTLPDSVTDMLDCAFYGCAYLSELNINKGLEFFNAEPGAFTRYIASTDAIISNLKAINVAEDNPWFSSVNGVLYNKSKTRLIACPSGKTGSYTVLNGTKEIDSYAFDFSYLRNLVVPASVETIGDGAIWGLKNLQTIKFLTNSCIFDTYWSITETDVDESSITIYAPAGSTAYDFSKEKGYPFVDIADSTAQYTEDTLRLYYSLDKNCIELGDSMNVGADYKRGNSFGMLYDGEMHWEVSNPEVLQIEAYSEKAALLYFKAIGLGSCDITLYLDGKEAVTDTVTVKVSDETLLKENKEYVMNSSAFSTLETARNTCKEIINGCDETHRLLASFFNSVENGLGVGVITNELLAKVGWTTSMAEEAEDKAVEKIMMELIGAEDVVGSATKKVEKAYKVIKSGYGTATLDLDAFFKAISEATGYSVGQIKQLHGNVESFTDKTDIAFDVLDVTLSAILISQFELETIKDMRDASAQGSALYLSLDRLYNKRSNLVAYATDRFLNEQAIGLLNDLIGKLGGSTYKIANQIGYWAKLAYDTLGGLDAEDYLVAQNNWAFAGYLYNYSLKTNTNPEKFERYYKYYVAAVKAALKSAVSISRDYQLTNVADSLYEQIELTCDYENYLDQVRDDLMNVNTVSKETLSNGKVLACYGGGIATYNLSSEENNEKILSIPAYIEDSEISGIADYGFTGTTEMQGVIMPQTIETIGEYAFANCSNTKYIYLNSGVTSIGEGAFENCTQLEFISLPESLQNVGKNAFFNCNAIGHVTFNENVQEVESRAFENCTGLSDVYFYNANTVIALDVFEGCENLTIYGYEGSTAQAFANTCGYEFVAFEDVVAEMRIITPAVQQTVIAGKSVSTEGLTVEVLYRDGTRETLEDGWAIACDTSSAGEKQVHICYKDGNISYPITVEAKPIEEITLSENELTVFITDSYQLVAECDTILTLDDLVWESDNTNIVTVNESGYIKAVGSGTAIITVCTSDGTVSAKCKVTVMNYDNFENVKGQDKSSFFSPNKSGYYSFYSTGSTEDTTAILYNTNGEIISFDHGKDINISAWLVDDEAYYVEVQSDNNNSFLLYVSESGEADGLVLNSEEYSAEKGSTYQLQATFTPLNALREIITWTSSDSDIAAVDKFGCVSLLAEGTATITATSSSGLTASCTITVNGYPAIKDNHQETITLDDNNPTAYFCFTPEENGEYLFYSTSDQDTYGYILDEDMEQLSYDDDSGSGNNFKMKYEMETGVKYILQIGCWGSGNIDVCIKSMKGDVNGNGTINTADMRLLRMVLIGQRSIDMNNLGGYDVNRDGQVNLKDLMLLRKKLKVS